MRAGPSSRATATGRRPCGTESTRDAAPPSRSPGSRQPRPCCWGGPSADSCGYCDRRRGPQRHTSRSPPETAAPTLTGHTHHRLTGTAVGRPGRRPKRVAARSPPTIRQRAGGDPGTAGWAIAGRGGPRRRGSDGTRRWSAAVSLAAATPRGSSRSSARTRTCYLTDANPLTVVGQLDRFDRLEGDDNPARTGPPRSPSAPATVTVPHSRMSAMPPSRTNTTSVDAGRRTGHGWRTVQRPVGEM